LDRVIVWAVIRWADFGGGNAPFPLWAEFGLFWDLAGIGRYGETVDRSKSVNAYLYRVLMG